MWEIIKSLLFLVIMVPVVMAVILGLIYLLGEFFNKLSPPEHHSSTDASNDKH